MMLAQHCSIRPRCTGHLAPCTKHHAIAPVVIRRSCRAAAQQEDSTANVDTAPSRSESPAPAAPAPADAAAPASSTATPARSASPATQKKRQAESTDAVATFLTRRFGLAGGLAWLGFLAVGTLGEQVKTRMEVYNEEQGAKEVADAREVVLPSGVAYTDLRVGGGSVPQRGYLVVVDLIGKANGEVFEDTKARGKPLVFVYKARPFSGGLCAGVEEAIADMKAGGRRIIKVPAALGFGEVGASLRPIREGDPPVVVPGGADLEYDLQLIRVSIPPS